MKKIFSSGGITKIFPQKVTIYIIALLSSLFISTLLSQGAFAATGSTVITVQSSSGEATAKSLNAWASESVTLVGLQAPVGGNCNSEPDKDSVWGKKKCIAAYIEGYNDRKNNTVARDDFCTKSGASNGKCPIAYDGGAYLARIEARGATPDLTNDELKVKRDEYCLSKSDDENKQGVSPKEACEKGYNAGYKGQSKDKACKDLGNVEDDCKDAYDAGDAMARGQDTSPSAGGASTEDIPCVGGPMGWVLCPIINYMADGIVALAGFIDSMMQFKLLLNTDSQNQIQTAVSSFTAVANLILVVAFLLIIFSQTTSLGLSNYGIKKMLPRVIITAILINLSFYLCAFAIDISNIVGNAIMGFITGQGATNASISNGLSEATQLSGPGAVNNVFSGVLGAAIGVILLIMFLGPLALGIFITFVILVARQVILLFLILVAPLAFAAWLLPNTESWFKKWKDLFVNMLIIYPMLMAIFGTALFAAKFISQIASTSQVDEAGVVAGDTIAPLISLLVLAIPLLALPFILRSSNAMLGKIANAAQKYGGQQASGALGKGAKRAPGVRNAYEMANEFKEGREERYKSGSAKRRATRATGGGWRGVVSGGVTGSGQARAAAAGVNALDQIHQSEVTSQAVLYRHNFGADTKEDGDKRKQELENALKSGDKVKIEAIMDVMVQGGKGEIGDMGDIIKDFGNLTGGEEGSMEAEREDSVRKARLKNWTAVKAADPDFAGYDLEGAKIGPKQAVPLSAEQFSTMGGKKISEYGESASDATLQQVKRSPQIIGKMDKFQLKAFNDLYDKRFSTGSGPPPPGGGPAGSPPPSSPPPSSGGGSSGGGGGWNSGGGKSTAEGEIRFRR